MNFMLLWWLSVFSSRPAEFYWFVMTSNANNISQITQFRWLIGFMCGLCARAFSILKFCRFLLFPDHLASLHSLPCGHQPFFLQKIMRTRTFFFSCWFVVSNVLLHCQSNPVSSFQFSKYWLLFSSRVHVYAIKTVWLCKEQAHAWFLFFIWFCFVCFGDRCQRVIHVPFTCYLLFALCDTCACAECIISYVCICFDSSPFDIFGLFLFWSSCCVFLGHFCLFSFFHSIGWFVFKWYIWIRGVRSFSEAFLYTESESKDKIWNEFIFIRFSDHIQTNKIDKNLLNLTNNSWAAHPRQWELINLFEN